MNRIRQRLTRANDTEVFRRHHANPILSADKWPYPVNSVFNPGATRYEDDILLLVRVEDRTGVSHLTVARSRNGLDGWRIDREPTFLPDRRRYEETWGIEDPRITRIGDEYYILYTGYSPAGPLVCLATTKDFRHFDRQGPLVPPDDKDAALFPDRFAGRWGLIHRPRPAGDSRAHVWLSWSEDLRHWGEHQVVIQARPGPFWDSHKVGLGPPPIRTHHGWLLMYHGMKFTAAGCIYRVGLVMVDAAEPGRVLVRADPWVLAPTAPYERSGDVSQVVFPCGSVLTDDRRLVLYYGAADTFVATASTSLDELIRFLYLHCVCGRPHQPGDACDRAPSVGMLTGGPLQQGLRHGDLPPWERR